MIQPIGEAIKFDEVNRDEVENGGMSHLAMRPSVLQSAVNEPIQVFSGEVQVMEGGQATTEKGILTFSFLPSPDLRFEIAQPSKLYGLEARDTTIKPSGSSDELKAFVLRSGATLGRNSSIAPISGFVQGTLRFGADARIGRLRFHLLNFLDYHGERIYGSGGQRSISWPGRTAFDMGPWSVTLDSLSGAGELLKDARDLGGYVVTHVVNIERRSTGTELPKLFGFEEAEKALTILYYVFTFANGARCPCIFPFGYRHLREAVTNWIIGGPRVSPAASNGTWFAKHNPAASFSFADRLYNLWQIEDERSWLSFAINLYAESNRNVSGVDIELAKSQIALELLSWEAVQESQQIISRDNFERLSASDKVRLSMLWAGIPTAIPRNMPELTTAMNLLKDGEPGPFDGPFAITQLRNATIHATRSKRKRMASIDDLARYQAWQLSQSYVALLILRLLDYRGPYMPNYRMSSSGPFQGLQRLWLTVPWAESHEGA